MVSNTSLFVLDASGDWAQVPVHLAGDMGSKCNNNHDRGITANSKVVFSGSFLFVMGSSATLPIQPTIKVFLLVRSSQSVYQGVVMISQCTITMRVRHDVMTASYSCGCSGLHCVGSIAVPRRRRHAVRATRDSNRSHSVAFHVVHGARARCFDYWTSRSRTRASADITWRVPMCETDGTTASSALPNFVCPTVVRAMRGCPTLVESCSGDG